MGKKIAFWVTETADAHAMKTLMDVARPHFPDDELAFVGDSSGTGYEDIVGEDYLHSQFSARDFEPDMVVSLYSDMHDDLSRYNRGPYRQFAIDAAILKACKPNFTSEQKEEIIREFEIPTEKPIVVFGNVPYEDKYFHHDLIKSLIPNYHVIISSSSDSLKQYYFDLYSQEEKDLIQEIPSQGILDKLYGIADATINCRNLAFYMTQMNNFFEATENGPTFMVRPGIGSQYGYEYCKKNNLVVECNDALEIQEKLLGYLKDPHQEQHLEKRHALTTYTRETYVPTILKLFEQIKEGSKDEMFIYEHPESEWKYHRSYMDKRPATRLV